MVHSYLRLPWHFSDYEVAKTRRGEKFGCLIGICGFVRARLELVLMGEYGLAVVKLG